VSAGEPLRPIFPLDLVLLPTERLPLHIFEPRYKAMVRRSLAEDAPFGLLWMNEGIQANVGCWAEIDSILREYPDGRRDLLVVGRDRFRVRSIREHEDGYLEAETEPLVDFEPGDPEARALLLQLFAECHRLSVARAAPPGSGPVEAELDEQLIEPTDGYTFLLAARIELPPSDEQELLESESESSREHLLLAHLAQLRPRLQLQLETLERVRGNGRVHHG